MIGAVTCDIAFSVASAGVSWGSVFEDVLDRLDDDDRVVDDDADRQDQREKRDGVGREAQRQHDRKGADQGDRHGDDRDQGRTQVPEKDEDDDADEHKGFEQRLLHLVDHRLDKDCRVVHHVIGDILREAGLDLLQRLLTPAATAIALAPGDW